MSTEVLSTSRSATDVLEDSRALVEPALRRAVDELPQLLRQVAGYHFGWWDEQGRPARAGGKQLRPALVLLATEAMGNTSEAGIPAAAAVELVHNSTLLHDDVIDDDVTRRHRLTAWRVFGRPQTILAGDALLAAAYDMLLEGDDRVACWAARLLCHATREVMGGQSDDVAFEDRRDVDLAECVTMARAKTSALLGVACALGGLYGGGSPDQIERLTTFGAELGLAFQHVDDQLGIWGDPAATGKPVHSDLVSRKKSLPVVAALASDTAAGLELRQLYDRDTPLTDAEAAHAAELVDLAGGRDWSRDEANRLVCEACEALAAADPEPVAAAVLTDLARLVTRREH